MFRTSSVHHQERFVQAVFADFGMWYYAYYSTRPAVTTCYVYNQWYDISQNIFTTPVLLLYNSLNIFIG